MNRSSSCAEYFRELLVGARQYTKAVNSPGSCVSEQTILKSVSIGYNGVHRYRDKALLC